jgi:hypothetical protein
VHTAVHTSETSVYYNETTQCNIAEGSMFLALKSLLDTQCTPFVYSGSWVGTVLELCTCMQGSNMRGKTSELGTGKTLLSQTKEAVWNVYALMKWETNCHILINLQEIKKCNSYVNVIVVKIFLSGMKHNTPWGILTMAIILQSKGKAQKKWPKSMNVYDRCLLTLKSPPVLMINISAFYLQIIVFTIFIKSSE